MPNSRTEQSRLISFSCQEMPAYIGISKYPANSQYSLEILDLTFICFFSCNACLKFKQNGDTNISFDSLISCSLLPASLNAADYSHKLQTSSCLMSAYLVFFAVVCSIFLVPGLGSLTMFIRKTISVISSTYFWKCCNFAALHL